MFKWWSDGIVSKRTYSQLHRFPIFDNITNLVFLWSIIRCGFLFVIENENSGSWPLHKRECSTNWTTDGIMWTTLNAFLTSRTQRNVSGSNRLSSGNRFFDLAVKYFAGARIGNQIRIRYKKRARKKIRREIGVSSFLFPLAAVRNENWLFHISPEAPKFTLIPWCFIPRASDK